MIISNIASKLDMIRRSQMIRKTLLCIAFAALIISLFSMSLVCAGEDGYPKTIVDSANRTVTIDKQVSKIVPLVTWSYEPIYILEQAMR